MAFPARDDAPEFVEPGEQALDLPAATITTEGAAVLGDVFATIAAVWRNQLDALGSERPIERITVVGTIPDKSSGSSHGEGLSEGRLDPWMAE